MNMPIKFDTLEYARKLAEAGIPADQAEAQANALSDVLQKQRSRQASWCFSEPT